MNREIGGEFWFTKALNENLKKGSPDWVNAWGNNVLTSSGRGAISLMLKHEEDMVISKTALLPAYTCESVIIPFDKEGYTCFFYDVDKNLRPNMESINAFLGEQVGLFLHMGYFGFSTNNNLHDCINQLKRNRTIIVEDITHTLFSKYERYTENDYYIASLRKWTGLPSGGVLASKNNNLQGRLDVQTYFSSIREEALLLKGKYMESNNQELKQIILKMFHKSEKILDDDPGPYSIDDISNSIISELDINKLITKRRKNFKFLLKALKEIKGIEPVFNNMPDNICPLFFPVFLDKGREKFKRLLINESIYCPIHWPIPQQIDISNYPLSEKIYNSILSIPCDQRYNAGDMGRIVNIICNYY